MEIPLLILFLTPIWGLPSRDPRIIGGTETAAGQYAYAAAIYKTTSNGNYFCTGSLLSTEWVITAGQCVHDATLFTILIGTHKLDGDEETVQKVATGEYVLHPEFDPQTLANDVGLIKFRSPISLGIYVKTVRLPFNRVIEGITGTAIGWGQISDDNSNLSNTLHEVRLTSVSDILCRMTYGSQISENMACFEGNYNEGTCYGDSGSPIVQSIKGVYDVVIAVSSFFSSNGCESTDPSGYTLVLPYNDWIKNVTGLTN